MPPDVAGDAAEWLVRDGFHGRSLHLCSVQINNAEQAYTSFGLTALVSWLSFAICSWILEGLSQADMQIERLPVYWKHRSNKLYPSWAYILPTMMLRLPFSFVEGVVWTALTYWVIGFAPTASRSAQSAPLHKFQMAEAQGCLQTANEEAKKRSGW